MFGFIILILMFSSNQQMHLDYLFNVTLKGLA